MRHSAKLDLEVSRMKRWKLTKRWTLVWGFLLLVGGMVLYTGYPATFYSSSPMKTPIITNVPDQAVSETIANDLEAEETPLKIQTQTKEIIAYDQASVLNSSKKDQNTPKEQSLKDFPCPVQGSPLRNIGNYYSEAFDNYIFHAGIDYAEPEGTVIRATHGGGVIFSGADPILGQKVILDCGEGWFVTYGGLANLRVQVGNKVETQDALGQVGLYAASESESDQPQLHYEVWHGNEIQGPR